MSAPARRRQLIQTAMRLFSRRGFAGTTTREIASRAGVTEAVIFQHFATKEGLYAAIIDFKAAESRADVWIEEMRACGGRNDDAGVVRTLIERILDQGSSDRQFLRLMLHSALEGHGLFRHFRVKQIEPVFAFLVAYVERRQREGEFRSGDPRTMVRALVAVPSHYVLQERLFQISDRDKATDVAEELTRFVLAGLRRCAPAARRVQG
jgi:TetR/AcrR family transcriptional regulator